MKNHQALLLTSLLLLANCSKSSGNECKSMLNDKIGRAIVVTLLEESGQADAKTFSESTLLTRCNAIPAKVLSCYRTMDLESKSCDSAIGSFLGMSDNEPKGKAPEPEWSLDVEKDWYAEATTATGLVLLAYDSKVVALQKGALLWERTLEDLASRMATMDGCVLVPTKTNLHCLDYADGTDLFVAQRPENETSRVENIAAEGADAIFVSDNRVQRLNAKSCAKKPLCVENTGIETSPMSDMTRLDFSEEGFWTITEDTSFRSFSPKNVELFRLSGTNLSAPSRIGNEVALITDNQLVTIDLAKCGESQQTCQTKMGTVDEEGWGPVLLPSGDVVYTDGYGVISSIGKTKWQADAGNDSNLLLHNGYLFSVGHHLGLSAKPPTLRKINPETGATEWLTDLPGRTSVLNAGTVLAAGPDMIVVIDSVNNKVHWLQSK